MAKAAKLKVYCMPAGFYDAIVAAPSQKAALRAWGTTTDLFAAGRASIVEDEAIQAEALAHPGEVIKRSRGDEAAMLGPRPSESAAEPTRPKPPPARKPPDRSKLDAAETALTDAERDLARDLDALAAERAEVDRREAEVRAAAEKHIRSLRRAHDAASKAYRDAMR